MSVHPLDSPAEPEALRDLEKATLLSKAALERSLELATASPGADAWRRFASLVLLALGAALIVSGIVFFFAFNWGAMGRFLKLGLVEATVIATALLAWKLGLERLGGKIACTAAAVLVGVLLAVYGQVYPTGADAYELFLGWSLLIFPWVLAARFAALWLILIALTEMSLFLYWDQILEPGVAGDRPAVYLALFGATGVAWLLSEVLARRSGAGASGLWLTRLLAVAAHVQVLGPSLMLVFDVQVWKGPESYGPGAAGWLGVILLGALLVCIYATYRRRREDVFFLATGCASAIVFFSCLAGKLLLDVADMEEGGTLLLGLAVLAQVSLAAWWLRRIWLKIEPRGSP